MAQGKITSLPSFPFPSGSCTQFSCGKAWELSGNWLPWNQGWKLKSLHLLDALDYEIGLSGTAGSKWASPSHSWRGGVLGTHSDRKTAAIFLMVYRSLPPLPRSQLSSRQVHRSTTRSDFWCSCSFYKQLQWQSHQEVSLAPTAFFAHCDYSLFSKELSLKGWARGSYVFFYYCINLYWCKYLICDYLTVWHIVLDEAT